MSRTNQVSFFSNILFITYSEQFSACRCSVGHDHVHHESKPFWLKLSSGLVFDQAARTFS